MSNCHHKRGGAPVGALDQMDRWEAALIVNLRRWCDGPAAQSLVWNEYRTNLPASEAHRECLAFEELIRHMTARAIRPLVRHDVGCGCVGSDEAVFANLVRTASDGHVHDAALISTLLVGPAGAEHIAMLAGQVGECLRQMHRAAPKLPSHAAPNVVRLH